MRLSSLIEIRKLCHRKSMLHFLIEGVMIRLKHGVPRSIMSGDIRHRRYLIDRAEVTYGCGRWREHDISPLIISWVSVSAIDSQPTMSRAPPTTRDVEFRRRATMTVAVDAIALLGELYYTIGMVNALISERRLTASCPAPVQSDGTKRIVTKVSSAERRQI